MLYTEGLEQDYLSILKQKGIDISENNTMKEWFIEDGYFPPVLQSEKDKDLLVRFIEAKDIISVSILDKETGTVNTFEKIDGVCRTTAGNYQNFLKKHPPAVDRIISYRDR